MTDKLSARVAMAEGPSRELDAEIDSTVQGLVARKIEHDHYGIGAGFWRDSIDLVHQAPPYSDSLDAAMTLIPHSHEWSVNWCGNSVAEVTELPDGETHRAHAATPAIALCAAALRARGL